MKDKLVDMNVYTIPPTYPFADVLAATLLEKYKDNTLELTDILLLLPTRRACRTMQEAFVRHSNGQSLLLPRITPIGDIEDEAEAITTQSLFEAPNLNITDDVNIDEVINDEYFKIPQAINNLKRQLILTKLIIAKPSDYGIEKPTHEQAIKMAQDLGLLLDQMQTEGLSPDNLASIVPDKYSVHWQEVLKFLQIITTHWPEILKTENGLIDPADRRARLMRLQAQKWMEHLPKSRIIAAGSTGSQPTTAEFIKAIASLPNGSVILPGLDTLLDDESWNKLDETHPQFNIANLLKHMNIERNQVKDWTSHHPIPKEITATTSERLRIISETMRPSNSTEKWLDMEKIPEDAIKDVRKITCQTIQEEALTIAVILREVLETPAKTAALITPDRELARRVSSEMKRWGINIDDSAGVPLHLSSVGIFLRLCADAIASDFAPYSLLALLKHPLTHCGMEKKQFRIALTYIENNVLRGNVIKGLSDIKALILKSEEQSETASLAVKLVEFLAKISDEYSNIIKDEPADFTDIITAHIEFAENLSKLLDDEEAELQIWSGDDGNTAASFISELLENVETFGSIETSAYLGMFNTLMSNIVVRPKYGSHPRLTIFGAMEARLLQADLLILGGMNEGMWPGHAPADAWMSRPMRKEFGLPLPEKRIGLSAHDFAQAFCAFNVVITRAQKVAGTPTVPSRWLMRLDAVLELSGLSIKESYINSNGEREISHHSLATALDYSERTEKLDPPAPCPPVSTRPREISATQVEKWMRDPYWVYARQILKLKALEDIEPEIAAKEYGNVIHNALEEFVKKYPTTFPENATEKLLIIGMQKLGELSLAPEIDAFWRTKFTNIAEWFIKTEKAREPFVKMRHAEIWGDMTIQSGVGDFRLKAKADRIDEMIDGSLEIIDYKTGKPPSTKEVMAGFAPQLPLEAAIATNGGFKDISTDINTVEKLSYWNLKGGDKNKSTNPIGKNQAVSEVVDTAIEGLTGLVHSFDKEETPYVARPHPKHALEYSDYDHLSRQDEWIDED
ncbi:MAG: double-strand break repair protein AddB [Alphaproteobacteria bacterium]|nr:double-strand break repair protein AddB [Alphaproteobacteria bacterium]